VAEDTFHDLRGLEFMESRVPVLDALSAFVPANTSPLAEVQAELERVGQSRWYPVEGGHRVLVPNEGAPFSEDHFTIEPGAWDHDHCDHCRTRIPAMTLCWVTRSGRYLVLCITCKGNMDASAPGGPTKS
jgi:hypothetical protein